jgi:hypothetical protein
MTEVRAMKNTEKNSRAAKKARKLYHLDGENVVFVYEHAAKQEASESALIRSAVPKMQKDSGAAPFLALVGTVDTGSDGSVRHDEIIYEYE